MYVGKLKVIKKNYVNYKSSLEKSLHFEYKEVGKCCKINVLGECDQWGKKQVSQEECVWTLILG